MNETQTIQPAELSIEITENIAAELDTWARSRNSGRNWHRVKQFSVYVYSAWGGGYGVIVNAQFPCGDQERIEDVNIQHGNPGEKICPRCAVRA